MGVNFDLINYTLKCEWEASDIKGSVVNSVLKVAFPERQKVSWL